MVVCVESLAISLRCLVDGHVACLTQSNGVPGLSDSCQVCSLARDVCQAVEHDESVACSLCLYAGQSIPE